MYYRVSIFAILLLLLSTITDGNRRVTVVRMLTEITTSTTMISTHAFCFSLKTVDGVPITPCRRRRQHWIEEPIFLATDDRIDEEQSQFIIEPNERFQVEPTPIPGAGSNNYGYSGLNSGVYGSTDPLTEHSLESSVFVPVSSDHLRFFFASPLFLRRMWAYIATDWYRRDNTQTTVTFTRTRTSTEREMTTKTSIIGISGCTPSPLPYDLCP